MLKPEESLEKALATTGLPCLAQILFRPFLLVCQHGWSQTIYGVIMGAQLDDHGHLQLNISNATIRGRRILYLEYDHLSLHCWSLLAEVVAGQRNGMSNRDTSREMDQLDSRMPPHPSNTMDRLSVTDFRLLDRLAAIPVAVPS